MWMNESDVEWAAERLAEHPTMGPATRTLKSLMDVTNRSSDGWAYWQKPSRAADKLMTLVQRAEKAQRTWERPRPEMPTAAEVKAAYRPIKTFVTKHRDMLNGEVVFAEPKDAEKVDH